MGLTVASALDLFNSHTPFDRPLFNKRNSFRSPYRIPRRFCTISLRERRVAIVSDVINAGSAVRGTFADLPRLRRLSRVGIGALLVLGTAASEFASGKGVILEAQMRRFLNTL